MIQAGRTASYIRPETEFVSRLPESVLASSYNPDDHTEYIDYEDGGLL
jgi:hypothetical protein